MAGSGVDRSWAASSTSTRRQPENRWSGTMTAFWHPTAWPDTLTTLHEWGITLLDPTDGKPGRPRPVDSGTGDAVTAAFDPAWVVAATGPAPSCG